MKTFPGDEGIDCKLTTIFLIVCSIYFGGSILPTKATQICAYSEGTIEHLSDEGSDLLEATHKKCPESYCYALWETDENNQTRIMGQGCWSQPGHPTECYQSKCVSDLRKSRARNNTKFCCCSGNLCNLNFTAAVPQRPILKNTIKIEMNENPKYLQLPVVVVILLSVLFFLCIIILQASLIYRYWNNCYKDKNKDVEKNVAECMGAASRDDMLNNLKLFEIIGEGRYGTVFKGHLDNRDVAVKLFKTEHRKYYLNEKDIYAVIMKHHCIAEFIGSGEYDNSTYVLILNLEQQNLQKYLINNLIDANTLGKMALDISSGLTYLHSDTHKPCIVHRDLNSKNILVRADLSCCICDMGLSVIPSSGNSETRKEAGTLRYMAPEILEGAVNLNECASSLKQVDIYAMGLVLWELGSRCKDLQNSEPGPYELPFYEHTGPNATIDQMQTLVSFEKIRPSWPASWRDSSPARTLRETTEDCWDQDADARLTAICVAERFYDFPNLKERKTYAVYQPPVEIINNTYSNDHSGDMSGATIETLLSPSDDYCKNSNQFAVCNIPLKPSQGRNPCLERNLLIESNQVLIGKSLKHASTENLVVNAYEESYTNNATNRIPYLQNAIQKEKNSKNQNERVRQKKKFPWSAAVNKILHPKDHSDHTQRNTQVKLKSKIKNVDRAGVTTSLLREGESKKRPTNLNLSFANTVESVNCSGISQLAKRSNSFSPSSLHQFNEIFSSKSDLSQLKDVSQRVKTPGDVPPSVRRTRGSAATSSISICCSMDPLIMNSEKSTNDSIIAENRCGLSQSTQLRPNKYSFDSGVGLQWSSIPTLNPPLHTLNENRKASFIVEGSTSSI